MCFFLLGPWWLLAKDIHQKADLIDDQSSIHNQSVITVVLHHARGRLHNPQLWTGDRPLDLQSQFLVESDTFDLCWAVKLYSSLAWKKQMGKHLNVDLLRSLKLPSLIIISISKSKDLVIVVIEIHLFWGKCPNISHWSRSFAIVQS